VNVPINAAIQNKNGTLSFTRSTAKTAVTKGNPATITAAWAEVVNCKASVVSTGNPTTIPEAVITKYFQRDLSGKGTLANRKKIRARLPAMAARPNVRVHGENPGNDNFTIGNVNEKISTPKKA
jgi:hypothetical protein